MKKKSQKRRENLQIMRENTDVSVNLREKKNHRKRTENRQITRENTDVTVKIRD